MVITIPQGTDCQKVSAEEIARVDVSAAAGHQPHRRKDDLTWVPQ